MPKGRRSSAEELANAIFLSIGGTFDGAKKRRKNQKPDVMIAAAPASTAGITEPKRRLRVKTTPKPTPSKAKAPVKPKMADKATPVKTKKVPEGVTISCEKNRGQMRARLTDGTSFSVPFAQFGGEAGARREVERRLKL